MTGLVFDCLESDLGGGGPCGPPQGHPRLPRRGRRASCEARAAAGALPAQVVRSEQKRKTVHGFNSLEHAPRLRVRNGLLESDFPSVEPFSWKEWTERRESPLHRVNPSAVRAAPFLGHSVFVGVEIQEGKNQVE